MKKITLSITRTLAFMTFGFVLAGLLNLINNQSDHTALVLTTSIIAATCLAMLVLNAVTATKILDSQRLSELVPTKLIGTGLSLTALLLAASIAAFILVLKIQPAGNMHTSLYALMGALSLPQSVITGNIGLRLN
ncbi:MAG: hypothetical protein J6T72_01495 [Alphaproteobacteria bacterium]|nr:hypothetical protein [Alphaproteobacteria bacterium]